MYTKSHKLNPLYAAMLFAFSPFFQVAMAADAPDSGVALQQLKLVKGVGFTMATGLLVKTVNNKYTPKSFQSADIASNPMHKLTEPNQPFVVREIRITGNVKINTSILHKLVADNEGQTLTLMQLRDRIAVITNYYHCHGLPNAFAIIPGQLVKAGIVEVQIIKMRASSNKNYDSIGSICNHQATTVDELSRITVSRPMLQLMQPNIAFLVKSLRITGNVKIDTNSLHALVADSEGKHLNLVQLRHRITRINDYYKAHGYPNARAIIPGQVIRDGVVEIQIIAQRRINIQAKNTSNQSVTSANKTSTAIYQEVDAPVVTAPLRGEGSADVNSQAVETNDFLLNGFVITGNKNIATTVLQSLVADGLGKKLNLEQLQKLVARMTDYYHGQAYPLARAVIPAQSINNGMVSIVIYEAYYGKINVNNHSRVKDNLLDGALSSLKPGQVVAQKTLNHALLLLSDIPGVIVNATLKPGEIVGTSDLIVGAQPSQRVYGNLVLDNYGNSYTGRARMGAAVNVIDPFSLGLGDVLSLSGLSSGGGLNYGRVAYEALFNQYGTRVGGSYSALHYSLGGKFADANAQGNAQVASLWAKHPIIRSSDLNLYGQVKLEYLQLNDHQTMIKTDRHLTDAVFNITGDTRDTLLTGGVNTWDVGVTAGSVAFYDLDARLYDSKHANTNGSFAKINLSLSRLQSLSSNNALYVSLAAQAAGNNLDTSQKMTLGGPYTVRAYDTSSVSGDSGYLLSAELRHDFGDIFNGRVHVLGFVDSAQVTINKSTWGVTDNSASLSGVGMGLNWAGKNNLNANAYIATSVGAKPSQVLNNTTRAWLEVGKRF
ncbi:POTRA domain-containing protein [Hydrogenophaga sp.]|uniref:POTRA domain-containing protein n=1 Tax=Hydrogenophaga sp. TaxID=1904254 RepID=UPI0027341505|nr:POTRA domain-containing protein [Hydrogenophaga sp.]MDP1958530.1 POTRA domain-containing protein [Methylotenera sp.]MDP3887922.1 POTRA domain-containing protein [Hydrogenophaga sp.]